MLYTLYLTLLTILYMYLYTFHTNTPTIKATLEHWLAIIFQILLLNLNTLLTHLKTKITKKESRNKSLAYTGVIVRLLQKNRASGPSITHLFPHIRTLNFILTHLSINSASLRTATQVACIYTHAPALFSHTRAAHRRYFTALFRALRRPFLIGPLLLRTAFRGDSLGSRDSSMAACMRALAR